MATAHGHGGQRMKAIETREGGEVAESVPRACDGQNLNANGRQEGVESVEAVSHGHDGEGLKVSDPGVAGSTLQPGLKLLRGRKTWAAKEKIHQWAAPMWEWGDNSRVTVAVKGARVEKVWLPSHSYVLARTA
jgi:hypothetical protein